MEEVVSLREGTLEMVAKLELVSVLNHKGLLSPDKVYVNPVAINTFSGTVFASILGPVPRAYLGKKISLVVRRLNVDECSEKYQQELYVEGQRVLLSCIEKLKDTYLPINSPLSL